MNEGSLPNPEPDSKESSRRIVLDVRDLEAPLPLEKALEGASALRENETLLLIHRREPCLLYPMLDRQGFTHETRKLSENRFEILIRRGRTFAEGQERNP